MTPPLDTCPSCHTADIKPRTVVTDEFGTVARYRCRCGKTWTCNTDADDGQDPPPGPD